MDRLRLNYPDKYQLWSDLVRGRLDRIFIASPQEAPLASRVPVEVMLPDIGLPIVVFGVVVGRRSESERFKAGLYIRFPEEEVEKCRRFLGVVQSPENYAKGRTAPRLQFPLKLQYLSPASLESFIARNISATGLFVTTPQSLVVGQHVSVALTLDDGVALPLRAEVRWLARDGRSAGLRFVDVEPATRSVLDAALARITDALETGRAKGSLPIVIADDEPEILNLLATALARSNYEVHQATTGKDALELIRELAPKLVILDILMPGIDGVDVCKTMRADAEMVGIPVIFLSAMGPELLHQMADDAGANDYLAKPMALSDLINLVGRYLRKAERPESKAS